MSARANIADLICIGCQKGSTSWLHAALAFHPDTHSFPDCDGITSTDKEAHFWDWNRSRGIDWYRDLLAPPLPHLRTMDFTPEYAFLTEAEIAECKALNPEAKVLYVLRDPLARAVSALRMELLWNHGAQRREALELGSELLDLAARARLELHGDYVANIGRWRAAYPDLIVLSYEALHADRRAQVAGLMARLGLDPGRIGPEGQAGLDDLMGRKVWESERFVLGRGALMFLDGLSRGWRAAAAAELGMTWAEGAALLEGGG